LDGLLPEGESRRALAERFGLVASDTFGLIRALGRDCAGALVIQPEDDPPPIAPTLAAARPLSLRELRALITNLKSAPLGIGPGVRLSLAGVQEKLVLTRMPDGGWGQPIEGSASTHIIKPPHPIFPDTVHNEAFCMRLAHHLGLPTARVDVADMGAGPVLVVERYDRRVDDAGRIERIHQEDFCQAFGLSPEKKYQDDGGPSLQRVAETLQQIAGGASLAPLLKAVTLNIVIGNCDAHAKNFSLLHAAPDRIEPAPFYDLMSTLVYPELVQRMAMHIDSVQLIHRFTVSRIVNEGVAWGMSASQAAEAVAAVLGGLPDAILQATEDIPTVPEKLVSLVEERGRAIEKA